MGEPINQERLNEIDRRVNALSVYWLAGGVPNFGLQEVADFIGHSRIDVSVLLAEVRRLSDDNRQYRERIAEVMALGTEAEPGSCAAQPWDAGYAAGFNGCRNIVRRALSSVGDTEEVK